MTPNGRRVWRRYSKEYRRGFHLKWIFASEDWKLGNGQAVSCAWSGAYRRRHSGRNNGHHIGKLRGFEPRPFTARSLVGMTMGARKRAVRREFDLVPCPEYLTTIQDRMQWYLLRGPYLRAKYRIGERLRPCPGCMECDPSGFASICDGSGVLPAGRQR